MNTDAQDVVATIERVFAALGNNDHTQINDLLCDDFHAYENGSQMTGRELLDLMSRYYARGRRYRWSVNSPKIEVQGNLGTVVYVNHGSIAETPDSEPNPMSWLETLLLRRQESGWRLAFLHSTRVKAVGSSA